jgi:hypothetical protein
LSTCVHHAPGTTVPLFSFPVMNSLLQAGWRFSDSYLCRVWRGIRRRRGVGPTRPRRRGLKSRGSASSVIVSTASKGSGGGGVGVGMEGWRRRRCYHDLHATVKSHEFHDPRGLGFCGYPNSTRSATEGAIAIGIQPSILVN